MPSNCRDALIEAAERLFRTRGFHASGIDAVLKEAGVSRMTLYNHFSSKDDLIVAALRRHDERARIAFVRAIEARASDPEERLLAVLAHGRDVCEGSQFCGCLFVNAAAEYSDADDPIRTTGREHKAFVRRYLTKQAEAAGYDQPDHVAMQIQLLFDGLLGISQIEKSSSDKLRPFAKAALEAGRVVLEAAPRGAPA
ncbi:MAG: TetR/AcrR family transcriptional regulator [Planctomycetota bacterium]